jgi:Amidohydrolase/Pyridine nucleotide-disulphide oxidoreductase
MDRANVDRPVVFPFVEVIDSHYNDWMAETVAKYPDRLIGFAAVNPWHAGAADEARRAVSEKGLRGLKLHPYVGMRVDGRGGIVVDEHLRTTVAHIWAAGDVIGTEHDNQMATPVGAHDGSIAAHNALPGEAPRRIDHHVIPLAFFTDPHVARFSAASLDPPAARRRPSRTNATSCAAVEGPNP